MLSTDISNLKNMSYKFQNGKYIISFPGVPDHVSFSFLDSFSECPVKAVFSKLVKVPETPEQVLGKAFHRIAELVGRGKSFEEAEKESIKEFNLNASDVIILENMWNSWYNPEKFKNILDVEHRFEIDILGMKVIGFIDKIMNVGNTIFIVDYKTGTFYSEEKARKHLQLDLYAYYWFTTHNDIQKIITIYDFITGGTIAREYSAEDFPKVKKVVEATVEKVKQILNSGEAEANPGPACSYCPVKEYCPAYKNYITRAPEAPLQEMATEDLEDELENLRTLQSEISNRIETISKILRGRIDLSKYELSNSIRYGNLLISFEDLLQNLSPEGRKIILKANDIKISTDVFSRLPERDVEVIKAFLEENRVITLRKKKEGDGK
jgi:CRISPR/Cas system-associated exonuclease Cas4 (RecB family)